MEMRAEISAGPDLPLTLGLPDGPCSGARLSPGQLPRLVARRTGEQRHLAAIGCGCKHATRRVTENKLSRGQRRCQGTASLLPSAGQALPQPVGKSDPAGMWGLCTQVGTCAQYLTQAHLNGGQAGCLCSRVFG